MKGIVLFILLIFLVHDIRCQEITFGTNDYRRLTKSGIDRYIPQGNYYLRQPGSNIPVSSLKNERHESYYKQKNADEVLRTKKFYLKLYGSYGFSTPGSYSVQSTNNLTYYDQKGDQHDTTIQSQGRKGIGGGFRVSGGIGYVVNDFLNLGVDVEYLMGTQLTNSLSSSSDSGYFYSTTNDQMSYKAITLSPHIIFKALAKPKYFIYNKLGILFTLPYTLKTSGNSVSSWTYNWHPEVMDSSVKSSSNKSSKYEGDYKISLGIGFNVAFGVNFRIGNNLRAFGELFGNFSALSASSSRLTTTTNQLDSNYLNNQLTLDPTTEYSTINTTFKKEGLTTNQLISESEAQGVKTLIYSAQDKKLAINMNTIGVSVGIIYRF